EVAAKELALIIEARLLDILQMANEELIHMGYEESLPAGIVLTGGVSLMRGMAELTEQVFQCSARVAQPSYVGVKSPIYSTAVGIIHYVQHTHRVVDREYRNGRIALPGFLQKVKSWFMDMFE
ncbi:MAG: cell division protein FtsA, partial [Firmicutes bacterium]|nr:cell division protein FtsA [Bacillota bacterium]